MSCCFLKDHNGHLQKQTQTAEGGEVRLWVSVSPTNAFATSVSCKQAWLQTSWEGPRCRAAAGGTHLSQEPGQGGRASGAPSRCAGVQDPQEEVRAGCAHTLLLGLALMLTCCPGRRKKPFRSCWLGTSLGTTTSLRFTTRRCST